MNIKKIGKILCLGVLGINFSGNAISAEPAVAVTSKDPSKMEQPITPERAQGAIKEMDSLFSRTTASKQVGESKADSVSGTMIEAEKLRVQAKKALAEGNHADAIRLSNEAKKTFFAATRKADPDKVLEGKRESDFKQRREAVNTLAEALKREAKAAGKDANVALKDIDTQIGEADNLAGQKKYVEGRKSLDKAYLASKVGLEAIKRGQNVDAKKDDSPKGVFEYDAFRNETYKSLTSMIIDERKKAGIDTEADFLSDVKIGDEMRKEGIALGEKKSYETASAKLGESTSAYKRAVRRAGVPIID